MADADWLASLELKRPGAVEPSIEPSAQAQALVNSLAADGELKRLIEIRVPELIAYQNEAYAAAAMSKTSSAFYNAEQATCPGKTDLSQAFARYLYKLMAYKDEYEVARLSLKAEVRDALNTQFGERARVHYLLQPPLLKALGLKRKIKLGRSFDLVYRALHQLRFLRGTRFDLFGYDRVRRVERDLIAQYRRLIFAALDDLSADNYERAVELAKLPDMIRGYDEVKLGNVERFWEAVQGLGYAE